MYFGIVKKCMIFIPRIGYQARYYFDPLFRRLKIDRDIKEEESLKKDKSPPDNSQLNTEKQSSQKLEDLIENSKVALLKIKTAIPLNPFPDKVIVDINKVTIIYQYFFSSEHIHSISIKDISDVLVETGLFFSTLKIIDVGFTENSIDINYLKTKEAIRARKLIQGLIVAHKNGIDLSKNEFSNLCAKLEDLGNAEETV